MLLSLECYPLDWFSLCVFDCCKYHCHLLRITLASLPYLSPLMSCLIGEYCWSPILQLIFLFWISWTEVVGTALLLVFFKNGITLAIDTGCCCVYRCMLLFAVHQNYSQNLCITILVFLFSLARFCCYRRYWWWEF